MAIPAVARLRSFAAYADATLEQLLQPVAQQTERLEATTLEHMVFFNRGSRFEAVPLPAEAQFAPAFHVSVADFDGDGAEDVFLAQNFSATPVGVARYDAGRGLLLRNDGAGRLIPLSGAESGIAVYGDQRGAAHADADGDGRLDLAVSQNGAETRFFRNRGARPGLRVRVEGPEANPAGIGMLLRVVYGEAMGPAREIQAGAGYWSQHGAIQVLGLRPQGGATALWVRWPGGGEARVPLPAGAREVVVRR
jgi:hypothetical protein